MSKRFSDSRKWQKSWLLDLPNEYKLLWFYMLDTCSIAGVWDVSFKIPNAIFDYDFKPDEAVKFLDKQITVLSERKWFINDFIIFQYKKLNPSSPPHKAVINELEQLGIWDEQDKSLFISDNPEKVPRKKPAKKTAQKSGAGMGSLGNIYLSEDELGKLSDKYGKQKSEECIEFLSLYKEEKAYKTKSDYMTILRWVGDAVDERRTKKNKNMNVLQKGQSTEDTLKDWHKPEGAQ